MKPSTKLFARLHVIVILLLFSIISLQAVAQCPASITTTPATTTAATCPSNGQIVVNSNVSSVSTATYRITSGPTGYPTNTFSSNTIPSLRPGTYTVLISCGSATATVTATVANNYTAPTVNATVSTCTSHTLGGTITISGAGSSAPLQYAVVQSTDPNVVIPDGAFSPLTTTTTYGASAFGTYQVRVKDACNNFTTQTVNVLAINPKGKLGPNKASTTWNCANAFVPYQLLNFANSAQISKDGANYQVEIWESTGNSCSGLPAGAPTQSYTINSISQANIQLAKATRSFFYRMVSPCGEVTEECVTDIPAFSFIAEPRVYVGCPAGSTNSTIAFNTNGGTPFTLTYTTSGGVSGTVGPQSNAIFRNLPAAASYTYTFSDGCGNSQTGTVVTPPPGAGVQRVNPGLSCTTVPGAMSVEVYLNGLVPGFADMTASNITLVNIATGAVHPAVRISVNNFFVTFYDVPAGNYNLVMNGGGGTCPTTIPVTVTGAGMNFNLSGVTSQQCGGLGQITASTTTNATSSVVYVLKNEAGTEISRNATGLFTNLPAGNYIVTGILNTSCSPSPYQVSRPFTIAAAGVGPQVVKKIGVTCEPTSTTGMAGLELAGSGPFKIEMKKKAEPETAFAVIATAAPNNYTENGLDAGVTYDFRIQDACGITTSTEVTILPLIAVNKLTTMSPCAGQPYTLSVENLPGATYSWTFNGGGVIATSPDLHITSFNATNNGTYVCTVSFGGCVSRTVTYTVSSTFCGSPLSVKFGNINAALENDQLVVNWSTESEENNRLFEVEVSTDGTHFKSMGTVESKATAGSSNQLLIYSFKANAGTATAMGLTVLSLLMIPATRKRKQWMTLIAIAAITIVSVSCNKNKDKAVDTADGNVYVRIAQVDIDGTKSYSKIVQATR